MYQRFEELCKEKNVTPYRVAKDTGITTATLSNWKAGRYQPKADKLLAIADYFGVSYAYLIGKTNIRYVPKNIGERIRVRREELNISKEEFADRLGYPDVDSINAIEENGDSLTTPRIADISKVLQTNVSWLMGWDDNVDREYPFSNDTIQKANDGIERIAGNNEHYFDNETAKVAQDIFQNEDMRLLFDAAKDSKPEDLKMAADLLLRLKKTGLEE